MREFLRNEWMMVRRLALTIMMVLVAQWTWAEPVDPNLSFSASEATATITDAGVNLIAPSLTNPNGVAVTYSSSNTAVAEINSSGNVTVIAAGQTTISAVATDATQYTQTPASYLLTVVRDITGATITLSATSVSYDGTAKTPTVSSVTKAGTALDATYYTVTYSNNTDVADANDNLAPTVIVTGNTIYSGSASTTFTITKGTAGLSFSQTAVSMTMGESWTQPTLTNPHSLAVTYSSTNTDVATVDGNGTVTVKAAGETTIKAAFSGNGNYEAQTVSYSLIVREAPAPEPDPTPAPPVEKGPAELSFSASEANGMVGEPFTAPTLNNPHDLSITYSSSNEDVATVNGNGTVTLRNFGYTTISASFAGNDWYEAQTVSYQLSVKVGFGVWVGGTQATTQNFDNVRHDGHFFYDVDSHTLVVTSNPEPLVIESSLGDLTVFLNGNSRIERIVFKDQGRTGRLRITTYADIPGKMTLTSSNAVISGFTSVEIDKGVLLYVLDPEGGRFENGQLVTAGGSEAKKATIGQYIKPLVDGKVISFSGEAFEGASLTNTVIDNVLFTLVQHAEDTDEDDDYYDPTDGCVVQNNPISRADVMALAEAVEREEVIPGSKAYAPLFPGGITFMAPTGEGVIELDLQNEAGYRTMLQIGTGEPQQVVANERGKVKFNYNVSKPTYCYLFMEKGASTRIGKREKSHGKRFQMRLLPKTTSTNPLDELHGFPSWQIQEVESIGEGEGEGTTGIREIETAPDTESVNDVWYTLTGHRITAPTKPGIYIYNHKKLVVR